eukprot:917057-Rhodomonas_salina.1
MKHVDVKGINLRPINICGSELVPGYEYMWVPGYSAIFGIFTPTSDSSSSPPANGVRSVYLAWI